MSTLFIIATPIGNLQDFSFRALETLKQVDLILCEDTRVTKKLLGHYKIEKPVLSYHQHSKLQRIDYILDLLKSGKNLALVSDAGTPGISDPGNLLIKEVSDKLGGEINIIPIPGPSAAVTAASISGFPMDRFLFLGFPPQKRKRQKFFKELIESKYPVVFYESPYRIIKTLNELAHCSHAGIMNQELRIVVARELTKKFETIYRGNINEVLQKIEADKILGEFVVIVNSRISTNSSTNLHK